MLSKKKKIFILAGMIALLVLTGCLNIFLNNGPADKTGGEVTYSSFFEAYRATRVESRKESLRIFDEIINNTSLPADAIADAVAGKTKLSANIDTELVLEGLIHSMGFADAVVTASTENINVIVKTDNLTGTQAAQILEVVVSETGKSASNVRIIPVQ